MDVVEAVALKRAIRTLARIYARNYRFTALDICRIHETWLGGIYPWAGKYRQVNVSRGDFPFAAAAQIPVLMGELEAGSLNKNTPCCFESRDRVIQALAEVHVELILIHPFREGNGRIARVLATLMASQANLPLLNFEAIGKGKREAYFAAVRAGLDRNYRPMEEIFKWVIEKTFSAQQES
jgi:cell filamentation protein